MRALLAFLTTLFLAAASPWAWASAPVRVATNPDFGGGVALGNVLLYAGDSIPFGVELWRSDGTEVGTVLVKDLFPGTASSYPSDFVAIGALAYVTAEVSIGVNALWKSDATTAGTSKVLDLPGSPVGLTAVGSVIYFNVDAFGDWQVWRSDGTPGGTLMVRGGFRSPAEEFTAAADKVFFSVDHVTYGEELWMTDGTFEGTGLVKDINPGAEDGLALGLRSANGVLLFGALSSADGLRMWRSDGTSGGTQLVGGPRLTGIVGPVLGNAVLMAGGDAGDNELWRSDGTANGTWRVSDLLAGGAASNPHDFAEHGGRAYFIASTPGPIPALFRSDGTAGGTDRLVLPSGIVPTRMLGGDGEDIFFVSQRAIWGADRDLRIARKRYELAGANDLYVWFHVAPGGLYFSVYRTDPGGDFTELWFLPSEDPAGDQDFDGVPNGIEPAEGLNAQLKDNDIFTSPRLFAMQQYRDFLGREGDAGGIQFYVNLITSAQATREQIIESFLASPEFATGLPSVIRLYFATFLRIPDYGGLIFQVNALRAGTPLDVIANNFTLSPEFQATYGSLNDNQYVALLYQNILNRTPSQPEIVFHVARLVAGVTRGAVLVGFSESPEFQQLTDNESFVVSVYVGLLRRTPEQSGLDFYVNLLAGGLPRGNMIPGFSNSPEYRGRFLP